MFTAIDFAPNDRKGSRGIVARIMKEMEMSDTMRDLVALINNLDSACNAGDIEGVMAFIADNAVLKSTQDPKIYSGKQQIREWFEPQMNHIRVDSRNHKVKGDTVTWEATLTGDIIKQMGADSIDQIQDAIIRDGKIASFTLILISRTP
jgi:ketosteroid isomerase-like protein